MATQPGNVLFLIALFNRAPTSSHDPLPRTTATNAHDTTKGNATAALNMADFAGAMTAVT